MSSTVIDFPVASVRSGDQVRPSTLGAGRPAPAPQVRLTRRGRAVVLVVALVAALLVGVLLGGGSVATEEAGQEVPTQVLVVSEGDTLWGIAADIAEDGQVREIMREIQRLNALDTKVLQLGQKLRVPLAGK